MPKIDGVLETALYTDDMERACDFYQRVLGLKRMLSDSRLSAFAVGGHDVLLLFKRGSAVQTTTMPGGVIPGHDGQGPLHVAFAIGRDELDRWERHLAERGVALEGHTDWPRGGRSVYFRDPDGHLLELATPGLWTVY